MDTHRLVWSSLRHFISTLRSVSQFFPNLPAFGILLSLSNKNMEVEQKPRKKNSGKIKNEIADTPAQFKNFLVYDFQGEKIKKRQKKGRNNKGWKKVHPTKICRENDENFFLSFHTRWNGKKSYFYVKFIVLQVFVLSFKFKTVMWLCSKLFNSKLTKTKTKGEKKSQTKSWQNAKFSFLLLVLRRFLYFCFLYFHSTGFWPRKTKRLNIFHSFLRAP